MRDLEYEDGRNGLCADESETMSDAMPSWAWAMIGVLFAVIGFGCSIWQPKNAKETRNDMIREIHDTEHYQQHVGK